MLITTKSYLETPAAKRLRQLVPSSKFEDLPHLHETTARGFWDHLSTWGMPAAQAKLDPTKLASPGREPNWASALLFFVDHSELIGGGFAVLSIYSGPGAGTQRFFRWRVCDHTFERKEIGRCLNRYTCTQCGESYEVDSGD